jgi:hypothetical protein
MTQHEEHAHPKGPLLGHDIRFNEDAYPFWKEHFDKESREAMVKEDLQAGEFVSAELFIIVFVGVALGLIGALAAIWAPY